MSEDKGGPATVRSVALDVLRIAAATWVVMYHWGGGVADDPHAAEYSRYGYLGVPVFFILSGAVIIHTALGRGWVDFAQRRFLRLIPAYLFAVLASIGLAAVINDKTYTASILFQPSGLNLWLQYPSTLGVAWTLLFEVNFYILVGVLILRSGRLTPETARRAVMAYLIVTLVLFRVTSPFLDVVLLRPYGPLFALGAIIGLSTERSDLRRNLPIILLGAYQTFDVLLRQVVYTGSSVGVREMWALGILVVSLGFLLWDPLTRRGRAKQARWRSIIATLSLMTYPVYLLHADYGVRAIDYLRARGWADTYAFAVAAVTMLAGCWLIVRWFEPWCRALLRRVFGWGRPEAAVEPASASASGGRVPRARG